MSSTRAETSTENVMAYIIESQARIIKQKNEEIERLKESLTEIDELNDIIKYRDGEAEELVTKANEYLKEVERLRDETRKIKVGDFELALNSCGDTFINGKHRSPADVSKKLRELYFRTEEKRSCENCGADPEYCKGCDNLDLWQPKQS